MVPSRFLPQQCCLAGTFEARVFCGHYSPNGNIFISACQGRPHPLL